MKTDDLKHASGGEHVDELAHSAIQLAHAAIDRFPEMKRKHMFLAGGAAISSALLVAAGVAVMRRVKAGAKPEDAVQAVTEDEIEGLRLVERTPYRPNGATPTEDASEVEVSEESPTEAAAALEPDEPPVAATGS